MESHSKCGKQGNEPQPARVNCATDATDGSTPLTSVPRLTKRLCRRWRYRLEQETEMVNMVAVQVSTCKAEETSRCDALGIIGDRESAS